MKRALLIIPLLAIILALPFARAASTPSFDHPTSLADQASDRAREALAARGTQGGDDANDHGSDNAADVDNSHEVDPSNSVVVTHLVNNGVVSLNITITVTPGEGVDRHLDLRVDAPGNDKVLPVGPPSDVPQGPPDDVPRGH